MSLTYTDHKIDVVLVGAEVIAQHAEFTVFSVKHVVPVDAFSNRVDPEGTVSIPDFGYDPLIIALDNRTGEYLSMSDRVAYLAPVWTGAIKESERRRALALKVLDEKYGPLA